MTTQPVEVSTSSKSSLDRRLAAYMAAAGGGALALSSEAKAVVVGSTTTQAFGINGVVGIDFNTDGQTDFQIDHDRVNLNGTDLDYLQIDKNDINGEGNPLAFDPGPDCCFAATPFADGATPRNDANNSAYVISGGQGSYPTALTKGSLIGPASTFDWQEGGNFQGSGKDIRANRLIDEDATQIDQVLGGQTAAQVQVPGGSPGWVGLGGQVRYIGLQMELNNSGAFNYGWIGVRITNEADATGEVVSYGYQTTPGAALGAGVIPEPASILTAASGAAALLGAAVVRRVRRKRNR